MIKNYIKIIRQFLRLLKNEPGIFKKIKLLYGFFNDYKNYKKLDANKLFSLLPEKLKPCLFDKTAETPIDYVYFYQDTWCAEKIFKAKPNHHYDVGSSNEFIGIISRFVPTTMIDIRPIDVKLPGLNFIEGDITALNFADDSLESISSICVIEHIGLGRYGDKIDPFGSEKAIVELTRVLAPGGSLYISLPVDKENTIYFNAHRAFARDYILRLFQPLKLIEEKYIYKGKLFDEFNREKGFGTGLFYFIKSPIN